jgi:hypothetical protein
MLQKYAQSRASIMSMLANNPAKAPTKTIEIVPDKMAKPVTIGEKLS